VDKRIPAVLTAALIAAFLLASCGDDDGGTATTGSNAGNGSANSNGQGGSAESQNDSTESSDEESAEGASEAIGKTAFLRQGNGICSATLRAVSNEAIPLIGQAPEQKRQTVEAELAVEVMAPALSEEVEQLQALGVPPGDEKEVSAILAAIEEVSEKAAKTPETVAGSSKAFTKAANLAERYGLDSCPFG
jgi:hypothetical protein